MEVSLRVIVTEHVTHRAPRSSVSLTRCQGDLEAFNELDEKIFSQTRRFWACSAKFRVSMLDHSGFPLHFFPLASEFELMHVDEFIDELLHSERMCDIILPRLQVRLLSHGLFNVPVRH